jgi:hypothetical protein
MSQGYTDIVCVGDRLVAAWVNKPGTYSEFGTTISGYDVISRDWAVCRTTGRKYRLNRRGTRARLFVGNGRVMGRI